MKHEGQKHACPKLIVCGLYIYKSHSHMGATPDNIFTCSCWENTCVEYKCPYSIRSEEVSDAWNKTAYLGLNGNETQVKKNRIIIMPKFKDKWPLQGTEKLILLFGLKKVTHLLN